MSTIWNRNSGDVNDTIGPQLNGVTDLSGVTAVEAHVWPESASPTLATTLAAAVASSTLRTLTVQLGDGAGWLATATPGRWFVRYKLTYGSAGSITWPEGAADVIVVHPPTF